MQIFSYGLQEQQFPSLHESMIESPGSYPLVPSSIGLAVGLTLLQGDYFEAIKENPKVVGELRRATRPVFSPVPGDFVYGRSTSTSSAIRRFRCYHPEVGIPRHHLPFGPPLGSLPYYFFGYLGI